MRWYQREKMRWYHVLRGEVHKALFIPWYDIVLLKFSTYDFCDRWESKGV